VDDHDDLRALVRRVLTRDGRFDIVGEATDGEDAIRLAGDLVPDLVVLDINMPTLDGVAALPRLRAAAPGARVVMLSAYPAEEMESASIAGGAVGYIDKTVDVETLADQLHSLSAVLETVQHVLDLTYDVDLTSPRAARADVRHALAEKVDKSSLDIIELLTSELVTNAIQHANSTARVAAALMAGRRIRVSVTDDGPGYPSIRDADDESESGRGLAMVELLASSWGIERHTAGKTVWFETEA